MILIFFFIRDLKKFKQAIILLTIFKKSGIINMQKFTLGIDRKICMMPKKRYTIFKVIAFNKSESWLVTLVFILEEKRFFHN